LKTNSESLPTTDAGSEFQTDGAAYRKDRFAKSVGCLDTAVDALAVVPWYRRVENLV